MVVSLDFRPRRVGVQGTEAEALVGWYLESKKVPNVSLLVPSSKVMKSSWSQWVPLLILFGALFIRKGVSFVVVSGQEGLMFRALLKHLWPVALSLKWW